MRREAAGSRAARPLDESNLGEKVSLLFRITGDPRHPFSEVVGLLQRIETDPEGLRTFLVIRRDGTLVSVPEPEVIRSKLVPTSGGATRRGPRP
ncbi:MAG: hypothetical protein ACREJP_00430 [Candidatus Methylomirabilales bacterium]